VRHQGVERPPHVHDLDGEQHVPLVELQSLAQAQTARFRPHRQHVGPMYQAAVMDAGEAEDQPQQVAVLIERAGGDTADLLTNLENGGWNDLGELVAPRQALDRDALGELLRR